MKKCKFCKSEIDNDAKVCPVCKRDQCQFHIGKILITVFLILVLCVLISSCTYKINYNNAISGNETNKDSFDYEVTNSYQDSIGAYYIEGNVKNNTSKEYDYLQISFVCYDSNGNNLGTAIDNTNNLLGNETWKFKAMGLFDYETSVDHCDYKEITGW